MAEKMKVLVTAGNTAVPIDQVRSITNIFTGRTGTAIASYFATQGTEVTLLTSNPGLAAEMGEKDIRVISYKTFDDLACEMESVITAKERPDIVIHSAAVSDFKIAGVFIKDNNDRLVLVDTTKKISSGYPELFLRMVPTEKLIDLIRPCWGFNGLLVKFKLEVGISDEALQEIARKSRKSSDADLIVANCLEWANSYAYIIGSDDKALRVSRELLPKMLFEKIENIRKERQ